MHNGEHKKSKGFVRRSKCNWHLGTQYEAWEQHIKDSMLLGGTAQPCVVSKQDSRVAVITYEHSKVRL